MTGPSNEPGSASRTTFERAQNYDDEFPEALAGKIIGTIANASILSERRSTVALRSTETVEALEMVLISIASIHPRFDQPRTFRLINPMGGTA
jgi:hypothetical protein